MALGWRGSYLRYKEFFLNIASLYKKRADIRAFLEIILSITTIIIFLVFALKPTALTIISLLQQIKEKKTTVAALTQKISDLQTAKKVLAQNQNFVPDIDIAVPSVPNPDVLSQQMEGLAAKDSVEILAVSVNQVVLIGNYPVKSLSEFKPLPGSAKEMQFSVSVRGSYANLLAFIKDFEGLKLATKIDTLGISSSVTDKGLVIVSVISGRIPFTGN